MDFIVKNFEKILLALCLIGLVYGARFSRQNHVVATSATMRCNNELKIIAKGKKIIPKLDPGSLDTLDAMLAMPQTVLQLQQSPNGNDQLPLFARLKYIICKNEKCSFVMPYNTEICPACNTQQDRIAAETTDTDDLDKDGIPDLYEKANPPLHYRNPNDALADEDGDGFLNLEEYRYGTSITSPASRPPLGALLRMTGAPVKKKLPIALRRIKDGGGSSNMQEWKAVFGPSDNKNGKRKDVKLAKPAIEGGFTLLSFAGDKKSVVIKDANGDEYTMALDEAVEEKVATIELLFLNRRTRYPEPFEKTEEEMQRTQRELAQEKEQSAGKEKAADTATEKNRKGPKGAARSKRTEDRPAMPRPPEPEMEGERLSGETKNGPTENDNIRFQIHVGKNFVLEHPVPQNEGKDSKDTLLVTEYYQLLTKKNQDGADVYYVQQIRQKGGGGNIGKPIELKKLDDSDKSRDYLFGDTSAPASSPMDEAGVR